MFKTTATGTVANKYVNELVAPPTVGSVDDADDRNITQDEIVNGVESSSQVLDPTGVDNKQLARAITIVGASAGFCVDSGAVNAYAIAPFSSTAIQPTSYAQMDGFAVQFPVNAINTGPSTIDFNGLGPKAALKVTTAALTGGEMFGTCTCIFTVALDSWFVLFSAGTDTSGVQSITAEAGVMTVGGTVSIPNLTLDALGLERGKMSQSVTQADNMDSRLLKAYLHYNMATQTLEEGFNIASVTRTGVGDGDVLFNTNMATKTYCTSPNACSLATGPVSRMDGINCYSYDFGGFSFSAWSNETTKIDAEIVTIAVFGLGG